MFDRSARLAFILATIALAGAAVGFQVAVGWLNVYLEKKPVPLRDHFDNIPMTLGPCERRERSSDEEGVCWRANEVAKKLSKEFEEELGTELYLDRHYAVDGVDAKGWINLHLAYYTGFIDAVPHVPDRCLVAGGFNAQSQPQNLAIEVDRANWVVDGEFPKLTVVQRVFRTPVTVHMPAGDFEIRVTEFSHKDNPEIRVYAGYFFVANGRVAVSPEDVKLIAFRKSEEYAYYCKIQFFGVGDSSYTQEDFLDQSSSLLNELLPELMLCLPDWPAVLEGEPESDPSTL